MRLRTIIALTLLAAVLAIYLLIDIRHGTRRPSASSAHLLPDFDPDLVERLQLESKGRPPLDLRRPGRAGRWQIGAPVAALADPAVVQKILSALEFARVSRTLPEGAPARQHGLDPARLRLRLHLRGREQALELRLGAHDVSGTGLYVRHAGRLVVVAAELYQRLDVDLEQLRDRDLVPFSPQEIDTLELVGGAGDSEAAEPLAANLRLERREQRWVIARGAGWIRAASGEVEALLGLVSALRLRRFVEHPPAVDLSAPTLRLAAGRERVSIRQGAACSDHEGELTVARERAGDPPVHGCVDGADWARLWPTQQALLDRRLTGTLAADLAQIEIDGPGGQPGLRLRRDGARWLMEARRPGVVTAEPAVVEADGDAIRAWVERLSAVRGAVESLADLKRLSAWALGRGGRVALRPEVGAVEELRLGLQTGRGVPIRRGGEWAVLWVSAPATRQLLVGPSAFRSKQVLALQPHQIRRIGTLSGKGEEVVERVGGAWRVVRPVELAADQPLMAALVGRLAALSAHRLVDEAHLTQFRGDAFTLECELVVHDLTQGDAPQRRKVSLAMRYGKSGSCGGRVIQAGAAAGQPFELQADDCALLVARRARRRLFDFDPAELRAVALAWPGGQLHFERRRGAWYAGSDPLEPARVGRMVRWIGRLEAQRVLAYEERSDQGKWRLSLKLTRGREQSCSFDERGSAWCAGRGVLYQLPERLVRGLRAKLGR